MDEAVGVTMLADELGIDREILYVWRRKYRSGGGGVLSTLGRSSNRSRLTETMSDEPLADGIDAKQHRIESLERKIGQ
jgi:transposase-like protein